jgi:hypothetical protein
MMMMMMIEKFCLPPTAVNALGLVLATTSCLTTGFDSIVASFGGVSGVFFINVGDFSSLSEDSIVVGGATTTSSISGMTSGSGGNGCKVEAGLDETGSEIIDERAEAKRKISTQSNKRC